LERSCFFLQLKHIFFNPVEADGIVSRFAETVKKYPPGLFVFLLIPFGQLPMSTIGGNGRMGAHVGDMLHSACYNDLKPISLARTRP
jgi:hypothetical protein